MMNLINCIEHDIIHWLKLDKSNTVGYSTLREAKKFTTFEEFRRYSDDIVRICYRRGSYEIMAVYRKNNDVTKIYFNELNRYHKSYYIPWIDMTQGTEPMFGYYESGIPKDKSMGQIKNTHELYSVAKTIMLSLVKNKYENNIISYYDSLPMFKAFSYMLGELDVFPKEEIIIEI